MREMLTHHSSCFLHIADADCVENLQVLIILTG